MAKFGQIFTDFKRYRNQSSNILDNVTQGINVRDIISRGITNGIPGVISALTAGGSVDEMKAQMSKRGGLAVNNRFVVEFNLPPALQGRFNADPRTHYILCESVQVPGIAIATAEYSQANQKVEKMPYTYTTDDIALTFLQPNDMYFRKLFDVWTNAVISRGNYILNYKNEYSSTLNIHILDRAGNKIYSTKFIEAYPINISTIDLSNTGENEILKMTVSMTYSKHE